MWQGCSSSPCVPLYVAGLQYQPVCSFICGRAAVSAGMFLYMWPGCSISLYVPLYVAGLQYQPVCSFSLRRCPTSADF